VRHETWTGDRLLVVGHQLATFALTIPKVFRKIKESFESLLNISEGSQDHRIGPTQAHEGVSRDS
jgi:hypothetical protein